MSDAAAAIQLHLPAEQLQLVRAILAQHIPRRRVWAFGSRATGRSPKRFSDLDLAIEGELSWQERAGLTEAFDESILPIKVDLIELDLITPEFRARIERDFVPVRIPEPTRSAWP